MLEVALRDKPLKLKFRDWFGRALGLKQGGDILTIGTQDANNSKHVVASQLIRLPPVVDSDEVPIEAHASGP